MDSCDTSLIRVITAVVSKISRSKREKGSSRFGSKTGDAKCAGLSHVNAPASIQNNVSRQVRYRNSLKMVSTVGRVGGGEEEGAGCAPILTLLIWPWMLGVAIKKPGGGLLVGDAMDCCEYWGGTMDTGAEMGPNPFGTDVGVALPVAEAPPPGGASATGSAKIGRAHV